MEAVKNQISKKEAVKLIKESWSKIEYIFASISWGQYGRQFLALSTAEEKDHRGFCGHKYGLTISESAKLFCVKRIVEALNGEHVPEIKDFLHSQKSWFFAHSLVANYREEIERAFIGVDREKILSLDYAELVKVD